MRIPEERDEEWRETLAEILTGNVEDAGKLKSVREKSERTEALSPETVTAKNAVREETMAKMKEIIRKIKEEGEREEEEARKREEEERKRAEAEIKRKTAENMKRDINRKTKATGDEALEM